MPLWLDLLRTPMAAPETPALRRMRLAWISACALLAVSITALPVLRLGLKGGAGIVPAILLVSVVVLGAVYFRRKTMADDAWLAAATAANREPGA